MEIRRLLTAERDAWLRLRECLWPDVLREDLAHEQDEILSDAARNAVVVASLGSGRLTGFVEVAIRD